MPLFSLTVETTSNNNASATTAALQWLMAAGRDCQLIGVMIKPMWTAAGQQSGRYVVDRITAVASGSALTPLEMDPRGAASALTDATKTYSTTLAAGNTQGDLAIIDLNDGWNDLEKFGIMAGVAQGFAIRRATAPTGAMVVVITAIWRE